MMPSQHSAAVLLALFAVVLVAASASPFQPGGPGGPGNPGPVSRDNQRHGSVDADVRRTPGVGTSVHVRGEGDVWRSRNGNSRVSAGGHYGQVVHGPARGQKDYGGQVRFEHRF